MSSWPTPGDLGRPGGGPCPLSVGTAWTTTTTQWSPLPARPVLHWPDDARLALCVVILLEHYDFQAPEGSYTLRRPSGGLFPLPFPDYVRLSHREYGHRVGIFRVLHALDRAGVPPDRGGRRPDRGALPLADGPPAATGAPS